MRVTVEVDTPEQLRADLHEAMRQKVVALTAQVERHPGPRYAKAMLAGELRAYCVVTELLRDLVVLPIPRGNA